MVKGLKRSLSNNLDLLTKETGAFPLWGAYFHLGPDYEIDEDVWVRLINDGLGGPKTFLSEQDPLYVDGKIPGISGRLILISLRIGFLLPADRGKNRDRERSATVALDIGTDDSPIIILPHDLQVKQRGDGMNDVNVTWFGYTLDTWEANGAKILMKATAPCTINRIEYVITRI
ncbi:MAG: hypothetical protein Unbinned200contig1000_11 [Prokaryotic dsDNA virus sp.]|jgi:hypothetical protein|nr:hypothetical protein [Flavobacteriaceae bacterium]QDP65271.1 MAG: hypothetical protein Unbinned200contig1000_11 [Prokaryotic dsDNA virus sp.]|tara:strand:+ start:20628 stop:21149 length:522 start_codon:yes stop_codon:yes gene_type:complete